MKNPDTTSREYGAWLIAQIKQMHDEYRRSHPELGIVDSLNIGLALESAYEAIRAFDKEPQ